MKNTTACCTASGRAMLCLLFSLLLFQDLLLSQGLTYPKQMDEVYVGLEPTRITFDARASLHNPVRFRFPPKALTFTIFIRQSSSGGDKPQHRRSQPQPLPAEAAAAYRPLQFGESLSRCSREAGGEAPSPFQHSNFCKK